MLRVPLLLFAAAALALPSATRTQESARLLRFPHVQGDRLAFTKGGDIWVATMDDLRARRLTSFDEGYEIFARISPDGSQVAFSAEYSGSRQVYVVPFTGGVPRQLTYYPDVGVMPPRGGYDNLPFDWTPDGRHILVRSNRTPYGQRVGRYFLVRADGEGLEQPLQIPEGGPATLSPDGSKLAYNIISREWRTWKRYTAGRAQDVWTYDLTGNRVAQLTDWEGTDNWPMWVGNRVYYTSDRAGGTLNLWCHELSSGVERQVTSFTDFDVLFPARGAGGIAFEHGGSLWHLDTETDEARQLDITLADDQPWTRPKWLDHEGRFGGFTLSPSAKRAVVEFRGELFSVPAKHGPTHNLTNSPHRRERMPSWSPDGKQLAFVAEHGTEQELYVLSFSHGQETRLTTGISAWIQTHAWSPDSSHIAVVDNAGRLWSIEVRTREATLLATGKESGIGSAQWSACGTWMCFTQLSRNGHSAVWVVPSDGSEAARQVTGDAWSDSSPSFDPAGRYLYFVSARDYVYGDHVFEQRVYALLLRKGVESPVAPRADFEPLARDTSGDGIDDEESDPSDDDSLEIDFDGLHQREVVLPLGSGSYGGLVGMDGGLLMRSGGSLKRYDLDSREAADVGSGLRGYVLAGKNHEHMLSRRGGGLQIGRPRPGQGTSGSSLPLDGLRVRILPQQEWAQMYGDAWRIMRDWFYDPDMHGVDWDAMRRKYLPLVPHIAHRADLDFLLGELIGELNCGHTYVQPGESPGVERVDVGTLGCDLEVAEGHYRIAKILDGENWNESTRSPLTEPGLDIAVGDFLLAIDGHAVDASDNPYRHLVGKAGQRVTLTVGARPRMWDAREVHVRAGRSDQALRYITWVNANRRLVDEMSGGRIGYLHCPNTAIDGHRELFEGWRAQALAKDAMIIDDRYNGGGFVPVEMAQTLAAEPLNYWARRHRELGASPTYGFTGPLAMLINGYSSSGGDAFPYYFRKLELGKLIGQRTWGGLVGYSGTPRLVDGGGLAVPNFAFVNTDGEWDVEAFGVAPDLEVFDDPTQIQAGREPVLEAAIRQLLGELDANAPAGRPEVPAGPNRSGPVDPKTAPDKRDR